MKYTACRPALRDTGCDYYYEMMLNQPICKNILLSLFVLLVHIGFAVQGQPTLGFKHLSVKDGLSQSNVNTIIQDRDGYIWIGTFDGLNKYDGYKFTVYTNDLNDNTSIPSNFVTKIIEDRHGYLWMGTTYGLTRFNKETGKFTTLFHDPNNANSISNNSIWSLLEDTEGNIWVGTFGGGLNLLENTENFPNVKVTRYLNEPSNPSSLSQNWVMDIYEDHNKDIWVATVGEYLNQFRPQTKTFDRIHLADSLSANTSVWSIAEDNKNQLWLGTETGLSRLDLNTKLVHNYLHDSTDSTSISEGQIRAILFDSKNNLWISTQNGLNIYNKNNDNFTQHLQDDFDAWSISSDEAWTIYEDKDGTIWIGTYSGGISYFHPSYASFGHVAYNPINPKGMHGSNVTSFAEDPNGNLWIGLDHAGLDFYNKQTGEYTQYSAAEKNPNSLSGNSVMDIHLDNQGFLWIGTYNTGLNQLNTRTQNITHYPSNLATDGMLNNGNIWTIKEDEQSNLWIGTIGGGLNHYNRTTNQFSNFGWGFEDSTTLSNENVWSILLEGDSLVWIGTSNGLNRYDLKTKHFKTYTNNPNDSTTISNHKIQTIFQDSQNRLWIGTQGGGLNLTHRDTDTFTSYHTQDGLANENISSILEDDHGNLWISTNEGLSKFNPTTKEFRNFKTGLQSNQFNLESCLKLEDGRMLFGGVNGYNIFHPDSIQENNQSSAVTITNFLIFNKPIPLSTLKVESRDDIPTIRLDHTQSVFSIEFSALNYIDADQIQYAHRLYNFESEWVKTGADRRFVSYTNIPAGEYLLSLKATNTEGVWMNNASHLRVIIAPPWWLTWWFRIATVTSVLIFIYFSYQLRMKLIYNQKKSLEEEVKARTAEVVKQKEELELQANILTRYNQEILSKNALLEDLHRQKDGMVGVVAHDLRSPLNNIKGLINLVTKSGQLNDEQTRYVQLITRLLNQGDLLISDLLYVNGIQQFDIQLHPREFNINEYITSWLENFQSDLKDKQQKLSLKTQTATAIIRTDQEVLRRILDNLFTNAMKFSEKGATIHLSLVEKSDYFKISITDEGPGISEADQEKMFEMFQKLSAKPTAGESSSGLGLSIVKALIDKLTGKILVHSVLGEGTEFELRIPKRIN
ncbi:hypothetical protein BFP72_02265 [Reichenbachiella sp. 5M10]|uniref:ligand-binding sensor domain-containing protein n=1 Tax=Reichenbachiella sp. 5M10 TaxID=1889772 RepID=UPI000C14D290|nr:sensor histidine kinase [Reichenbachiella sp. 5M10]PIB34328.1 hypothetical protein BFP72_02265 [Reichenbachiella sp. 5M10]